MGTRAWPLLRTCFRLGAVFVVMIAGLPSWGRVPSMDHPFNRAHSHGRCTVHDSVPFTHPPMRLQDIGGIEPYGLLVDAHVLPTSHGYVIPKDFHSPRDAYPVYAIADGVIVNVSHRGEFIGDRRPGKVTDEYQMYIEYSCTFYSYYDLLTSLAPDIAAKVGTLRGFDQRSVRIPVKAGQLVGRIGGQTLDFAVWNFDRPPTRFVNPSSYATDEARFYLDDMFAHFTEPLRSELLGKALRMVEPRTGKVDYDIPETLAGNWFREGSNGFRGPSDAQKAGGRYWDGHLAIVYDFIDPTQIRFSIGNYTGQAAQFGVKGNAPDPARIGVTTEPIKYELQRFEYYDKDTNQPWRRENGSIRSPGARNFGPIQGTVLLQLIEPHTLKLELFPEKTADQVSGFGTHARTYLR